MIAEKEKGPTLVDPCSRSSNSTVEEAAAEVKPRGTRGTLKQHVPYVWQSARALERIVNELGATDAAFGVAVYVALRRLSSKAENASSIEATIQKIAGLARISYPKASAILNALELQAKVISIERRDRQK